jgi:hypothetical protein
VLWLLSRWVRVVGWSKCCCCCCCAACIAAAAAGGPDGFHRRVWQASPVEQTADGSAVVLSYTSVDGEEVSVTFTM